MRESNTAGLLICLLMAAVRAGSLVSSLNQSPVMPHAQAFTSSSTIYKERKARIFALYQNAYIITHKDKVANDPVEIGRDPNSINEWTIVTLVNPSMKANSNIAIRSVHGRYIRASSGGNDARLELGPTTILEWENYEIVPFVLDENLISIKTYHGTWWSTPLIDPDTCWQKTCLYDVNQQKEWIGQRSLFRIEWI